MFDLLTIIIISAGATLSSLFSALFSLYKKQSKINKIRLTLKSESGQVLEIDKDIDKIKFEELLNRIKLLGQQVNIEIKDISPSDLESFTKVLKENKIEFEKILKK